ncbi:MAG: glycosyltransferase family 4 protein [Candidatus Helarchaeota archaeon]
MHIAHVSPRYFPAISGSEFYLQQISEILRARNHSVQVFCSNALDYHAFGAKSGKIVKRAKDLVNDVPISRAPILYYPGINVFLKGMYVPYKKLINFFGDNNIFPFNYYTIMLNGPFIPQLFWQLIQARPSLIHSVSMPHATNLFALLAGKVLKVPIVCTPFYHISNPRYHHLPYLKFLNKFHRILACSNRERLYLIKNGISREKIKCIHMGIHPEKYKKGNGRTFRTQFNIDNNEKLILFCGYKNFEKGAITLLQSIKYVVKSYPHCKFVFIGPSTKAFNITKRKLRSFRQYILNLGVVPYYARIKLDAFVAQDVFVMPSRTDAYGIAFLEAWINKKPVIGANIGATPEIIQHESDGLLVPFNSPRELANAIIRLLTKEEESQQFGEAGYQKARELTWTKVARQIENIYQEVLDN